VKTMAEVIDAINYERQMDLSASNVRALADALTAAGFGPVKEAQAEALRDAAGELEGPLSPYLFTWKQRGWLRDRAASIEATK